MKTIERGESVKGYVQKLKDGIYRVRIQPGLDPVTKKRPSISVTVHGTRKEADAKLRELGGSYDNGVTVEPTKMTLNQFLEEWLDKAASQRLKPRTVQDYKDIMRLRIRDSIGKLPLTKITPLQVQAFYNAITAAGLASQTVRNTHTVLRSAFKQAVRWRYVTYNPTVDVDLPRQRRKIVVKPLDEFQVQHFRKVLPQVRWGFVLLFALVTGARPGEYLALQWEDLDWSNQCVRINKTLFRKRGGGWIFESTKTEKSNRTIDLPDGLMPLLREHRRRQLEEQLAAGANWNRSHNFIFTNEKGGPIEEHNLATRAFKVALQKAGLSKAHRLYDLRHTSATLMLLSGEPAKIVSERLGHSTVTLTLDTYSHVLPTMSKSAAQRLGGVIFSS